MVYERMLGVAGDPAGSSAEAAPAASSMARAMADDSLTSPMGGSEAAAALCSCCQRLGYRTTPPPIPWVCIAAASATASLAYHLLEPGVAQLPAPGR